MTAARAFILLGAICFTLVAAYQWIDFTARNRQTFRWTVAIALILWIVWFYATATAAEVRSALAAHCELWPVSPAVFWRQLGAPV
jgi:hypothetical protein